MLRGERLSVKERRGKWQRRGGRWGGREVGLIAGLSAATLARSTPCSTLGAAEMTVARKTILLLTWRTRAERNTTTSNNM
jgi:hypothetical protein